MGQMDRESNESRGLLDGYTWTLGRGLLSSSLQGCPIKSLNFQGTCGLDIPLSSVLTVNTIADTLLPEAVMV
ncbi:predicted protein [Sclerotinia sclerotiorum 1980 UF-70]|uniref:Uncharacterized protein n=1 Tax=Sclerotinia sclerotiorum (strain ATCC 18683 / 1980 / Ss-1) TaxID=665079 RepID=A7E4Z8_SCLS1|nr:predicted protein [Sclerotinia sclerotiorum 1980 UF-70]EDN90970.1 predicted protein [Sclerotinia sclerotiorum 1980 UF-70]